MVVLRLDVGADSTARAVSGNLCLVKRRSVERRQNRSSLRVLDWWWRERMRRRQSPSETCLQGNAPIPQSVKEGA